jgi:nicotinate phosphoribosyltransferase
VGFEVGDPFSTNYPNSRTSGLLIDLYELTMAQTYLAEGMADLATFSLFVRRMPHNRSYLAAAGISDAVDYLRQLHFGRDDLHYLGSTGMFRDSFLSFLGGLSFTGDVWAMAEGTIFFPDEPVLEVTAPLIEAQLVETCLLNQVHYQCVVATKAARCVQAARGRPVSDFSLRRDHGGEAGLRDARLSYLAGFESTSNVLAGARYAIPIVGTMAHSFVEAFASEIEAFRAYARINPDGATLLIDTYDTLAGARKAVVIAREMEIGGHRLKAVRLDSGDMVALSRKVREILDDAGLA